MTRSIYFYQNEADLAEFFRFLESFPIILHDQDGKSIRMTDILYHQWHIGYITENTPTPIAQKGNFIQITTQSQLGDLLQPTSVILDTKNETSSLVNVYKQIKKYIQKHYTISDSKSYYVAPSMQKEWMKRKIEFPDLFKQSEFTTTSDFLSFPDLISFLKQKGYLIKDDEKDIRENPNELNLLAERYVITTNEQKLKTVLRKRWIFYLTSSECIFLSLRKKKDQIQYTFLMDKRLQYENDTEILGLFHTIQSYIHKQP